LRVSDRRHVAALDALQSEWQSKLDAAITAQQQEAAELFATLEAKHTAALADAANAASVEVDALRAAHWAEVAAFTQAQAKLESDLANAAERANAMSQQHTKELEAAVAAHESALAAAAETYAIKLDELKADHTSKLASVGSDKADLIAQHAAALEKLMHDHTAATAAAEAAHLLEQPLPF